jgi:hypothetical protein
MPDSNELLTALLRKAETGEMPPKKANMLKHLQGRVTAGQGITEMQAELLEELGHVYGLC